jgi:hypothetical protein
MDLTTFLLLGADGQAAPGGDAPAAGVLGIVGRFFVVDGQPFTVIETSDFSLFKRDLDGEDIRPIRRQRRALGFNGQRAWVLNQSVVGRRNNPNPADPPLDAGIHPDQVPDFYDRLRRFVGDGPPFVDVTVFTSCGSLMPERDRQQRHLDRTADAVRGLGNVILSLVNEFDQWDNATHPDLVRPAGVLSTRGSGGADSVPPRHDDPWDAEEYHSNDLDQWQRKEGHNAMEWADQSGRPCWTSESTRPDRDGALPHFEDAAENAALLCAGSCFHSEQGKYSRLFTGRDLAAAEAWVRGARKVPLEFQRGAYTRHDELNGPTVIRAHRRTLSDGRSYTSLVRP